MAASTAVTALKDQLPADSKKQTPGAEFRDQFQRMEPEIATALPPHVPVDRFMRIVLTAVNANPALLRADRRSLFEASMKSAQDGLLPDGKDGAFVTFRVNDKYKDDRGRWCDNWIDKVQWMPMVAGILKKVRNSGQLLSLSAYVAHDNDRFVYTLGDDERIEHEPALTDRGKPKLVYAIAKTKDGGIYREVMTVEEVEQVRSVSRAKDNGPWVSWWGEMARKTVIRRLAKRLPMSTDLDDLIRRDDALYDFSKRGADGQVERLFKPVESPLQDTIEHKPEPIDPDPTPDVPEIQANGDEPAGSEIDRTSPDFMLGYEGGIQGMPRKGLTAEIKADPVRLANYEAGRDAGVAQAEKEDE